MGEGGEVHIAFWLERSDGRDYLEDPAVDGRIILKRIFKK
jgi:hypothetical protein